MSGISKRTFLKAAATAGGLSYLNCAVAAPAQTAAKSQEPATVYFLKDLSADSLIKAFDAIRAPLTGKIAVKLHTGEPNGPNILPSPWVQKLIEHIPNSTIVETNVLYGSPRQTTEGHRQTLKTNGWTFAPVDILDEEGDVNWPIAGGKHLKEVAVGAHLANYDSMLVLTHFKGHAMAGFGGSLKNIAIGCASGRNGKRQIHRNWDTGSQFLERMVEGGKAVTDHFKEKIVYINVLRRMSVDCDCAGTSAAEPKVPDLGILASTDILAIDQASIDMVWALPEKQKHDLVERIESREGLRQLSYMEELGMGRRQYRIVNL